MYKLLSLTSTLILFSALFSAPVIAADKETVGIPKVVPWGQFTRVPEAVRVECEVGENVSAYIKRYGKKNVEFSDVPDSGRYIDMSITEVHAPGGGSYSGPKWIEVTGTLKDNGKDVASFRAKRFSTGGVMAGLVGTCSIVKRCTKAIGKDIANWLKRPYDGAALGDAR